MKKIKNIKNVDFFGNNHNLIINKDEYIHLNTTYTTYEFSICYNSKDGKTIDEHGVSFDIQDDKITSLFFYDNILFPDEEDGSYDKKLLKYCINIYDKYKKYCK